MASFPKPTARGLASAAVFLALFWRTDPATPAVVRSAPIAVPNATVELSAPEILQRMAAVYAACTSYEDYGLVWDEFGGFSGHVSGRPFETRFVRGGGFRFEYQEYSTDSLIGRVIGGDEKMVVWGDERHARMWWTIGCGSEAGTLDHALAGATGVSGGSSSRIPRLLLPDRVSSRRVTDMTEFAAVTVESIEGRPCYRIEGLYAEDRRTIWVDVDTFLLRRMLESVELETGTQVVTTTVYEPQIDVTIDPAEFAFEPPR